MGSVQSHNSRTSSRGASEVRLSGRLRRLGIRAFLVVWAVVLSVICTVFMVGHWVTLPVPDVEDEQVQGGLRELVGQSSDSWHLVHVLYSQCRCSQRIFDYLLESERPRGAREVVLLVGPHESFSRSARARGFSVEHVAPEELKLRYGIESAPLLLILSPDGAVRYSGGYTARKQGIDYRDITLLAELQARGDADRLPLYGCGTSRELQSYLDPIGLKYER